MSEPKRRWFQIHLSTAVVMMLVAGALTGANLIERQSGDSLVRGWPVAYRERPLNPKDQWIDYYRIDPTERPIRWSLDVAVFVACVILSSTVAEAIARRRLGYKQ